jgi:hypothetical protein
MDCKKYTLYVQAGSRLLNVDYLNFFSSVRHPRLYRLPTAFPPEIYSMSKIIHPHNTQGLCAEISNFEPQERIELSAELLERRIHRGR